MLVGSVAVGDQYGAGILSKVDLDYKISNWWLVG